MNNLEINIYIVMAVIMSIGAIIILCLLIKGKIEHNEEYQQQEELYNRNTLTGLTKVEESVLDIYEQSNIKIPLEIWEELRYLQLDDEEEIFMYIENQRLHWKLENSKKPYRRK